MRARTALVEALGRHSGYGRDSRKFGNRFIDCKSAVTASNGSTAAAANSGNRFYAIHLKSGAAGATGTKSGAAVTGTARALLRDAMVQINGEGADVREIEI